eukprot:TRINITY_DN52220_c0_g1_i1.p1 TRINITY_DN52220_c0_g1~~TRINITY_DN52220_c0_g1_i1.p1  ORF type:complete len:490 (-),score=118.13 TRINITY_DN52220_c0_g1_i1:303-1772(-)
MPPKTEESSTTFQHVFCSVNPSKIDNDYKFEQRSSLGEGSYGTVYKGTHRNTGAIRAIKAIDKAKISDEKRFQVEVDIQQSLDHPNIVKLYEVFIDAKRIYLVMELCTGGELFDRIVAEAEKHDGEKAFDERPCATYMQQILGAMSYLHNKKYCHRDIKPENFLLQDASENAEIKVIDFGLAKQFDKETDGFMKTKAGTPYYVAPEVLNGKYDTKCDVWSCGVIAYILLCGYPPFYGDGDDQILKAVKKGHLQFASPDWDHVSDGAKDFIKKMLTMNPNRRPSSSDMLLHQWLTSSAEAATGKVTANLGSKLKEFNSTSRMKKVALTLIAQQLKDEELKELRECFIKLDVNKDGTLTLEEIDAGMKDAAIEIPSDLVECIKMLDTDGSGQIEYSEFIAATLTKKQYGRREVMWAAFRVFDKDGDGTISKQELAKVLGETENSDKIVKMVKEVDTDGDGVISFDEFQDMMEQGDGMDIEAVASQLDSATA